MSVNIWFLGKDLEFVDLLDRLGHRKSMQSILPLVSNEWFCNCGTCDCDYIALSWRFPSTGLNKFAIKSFGATINGLKFY
jgi:hypothetical protein